MAWARSGRGGVGVDIFVPPAIITNIKASAGNSVVNFTWKDPEDITAEGVIVNEWEGTVIVVNKNNVPVDQNDGDIIYTSKVKNQHQEEPYTAEGLDVGQKYFFGIFPYSKYKVFNVNQSQTGEFIVMAVPPVKPLNQYTMDDIKIIANAGQLGEDGKSWYVGEVKYFTLGDVTKAYPIDGNINFKLADFFHDEAADGSGKVPFFFVAQKATETTYKYNANSSDKGGFVSSYVKTQLNSGTIYQKIPDEIKNNVTEVKKKYDGGVNNAETLIPINIKFFLLTQNELFGTSIEATNVGDRKCPIFTNDSSRIRKRATKGDACYYFTSSTVDSYPPGYVHEVSALGSLELWQSQYGDNQEVDRSVVFAFNIGDGRGDV